MEDGPRSRGHPCLHLPPNGGTISLWERNQFRQSTVYLVFATFASDHPNRDIPANHPVGHEVHVISAIGSVSHG
jgi:hypothetical protein